MRSRQQKLWKENGLCWRCGELRKEGFKSCDSCITQLTAQSKRRAERLKSEGLCHDCGHKPPRSGKRDCVKCALKSKSNHRQWATRMYRQVLKHYGAKCVCCGEMNIAFLSVDHVNNDGWKERKKKGGMRGGYSTYKKIIEMGFPEDLQIMCFNCNMGKNRNNGVCPHIEIQDGYVKDVCNLWERDPMFGGAK